MTGPPLAFIHEAEAKNETTRSAPERLRVIYDLEANKKLENQGRG
jgi:hypothetical protein